MTFGDIETIFVSQLPSFYDKDEAKSIAALAVEHVCNVSKSYYMLHKNDHVTLVQETSLIRILDELRLGRPLQYVMEEADFFGLRFKVNSSVLIPRPETEELVHWVLTFIKEKKRLKGAEEALSVLDIGTGSGCIPVALKRNLPEAAICALDISSDALETAMANATLNGTEVRFVQGDILDSSFSLQPLTFSLITSKPPYVTGSEKKGMHKNVLDFEPHTALFVPDEDPLVFYRHIADFSLRHLDPEGSLFLEINEHFGAETCSLLEAKGFKTELKKDLRGKDRMVKAWRE